MYCLVRLTTPLPATASVSNEMVQKEVLLLTTYIAPCISSISQEETLQVARVRN